MAARESGVERLRAALRRTADQDVDELLAEARAEARATVRSALTEALTDALFERARTRLETPRSEERVSRPPAGPQPARTPEAAPSPEAGGRLCYVYGVTSSASVPGLDGLAAIDPRHAVRSLAEGPLAALVSDVAGSDFSEQQLRAHLEDLEWVETVARRHEGVLDELSTRTTTIPMRMCTVYRAEDGVREMLRREAQPLQAALQHLAGKAEWGVKVYFDRRRARTGHDAEPGDGPTGAAYLEGKRRARDLDQEVDRVCAQIHEELGSLASESALNAPQRPEPSAERGEMVMNGVYLVEHERAEEFHQRVRSISANAAELGIELAETGPWPPYNFLPAQTGATW